MRSKSIARLDFIGVSSQVMQKVRIQTIHYLTEAIPILSEITLLAFNEFSTQKV
jgi:hypothetical protein